MGIAVTLLLGVVSLGSPDGRLTVDFDSDASGMWWSVRRQKVELVTKSRMGLEFALSKPLGAMKVVGETRKSADSVWKTEWYRRGEVRDRYNELTVKLEEEASPRKLEIVFRAYDEGVAFRYVVPEQESFGGFQLSRELTEWRFAADAEAWTTSYEGEFTSQEEAFVKGKLSALAPKAYVGMPVVVELKGATVALCEAALSNWAGLFYRKATDGVGLTAHLAKLPKSEASTAGVAVIRTTPAASPWRVMLVGDDGLDLLRKNDLIVNLNPAPDPAIDFSFVKPGATSWDWWVESNNSLSTELTLKLVDFAAEMGWAYHTIDGGWYGFARRPNHGPNVELKPRKNFDLERIVRHAAEKGVGIWVWIHWEEINDLGIEETFARLEQWGVKGVKTDFLNRQDQWMVNWCERVCRIAAKHKIMVNFHGAHHPSGTERTWPNNLTREGIRGNEFNIFNRNIMPRHCATLPFTRFLLGPGDFTPGSFANVFSKDFVPQVEKGHRYGDETDRCPHWAEEMGTRAHSLAQCIAFDSSLMTLCDWPERYRGAPGIESLKALPTTWKRTLPIAGKCGEYYAVVRETHDGRFYFAAITVKHRDIPLKLDFLGDGEWKMRVFGDDYELTPADAKELAVGERIVKRGEKTAFGLCDEGGAVAIFERVK